MARMRRAFCAGLRKHLSSRFCCRFKDEAYYFPQKAHSSPWTGVDDSNWDAEDNRDDRMPAQSRAEKIPNGEPQRCQKKKWDNDERDYERQDGDCLRQMPVQAYAVIV